MANYTNILTKEPKIYPESIKDNLALRKDPDYFWPSGTQVYVGKQGSGKTISAIKHLQQLKVRYPKAIIVSNILLSDYKRVAVYNQSDYEQVKTKIDANKHYFFFQSLDELAFLLVSVNNDKYGVIYLIDEIHTYFNALDSKNIPMFIFTEIAQQRKQRKLIIGTSQLFLRLAKPFREQCDNIIMCKTYFSLLTTQKAYDGMTLEQDYDGKLRGVLKKGGFFFHNRKIRNAFDTFQKVVSGHEQYENTLRFDSKQIKALKK